MIPSPGILFALITTLCWAIGIFPFTQAARRLGVNSLNHFRLVLAAFSIGLIALLKGGETFFTLFSPLYSDAWLWVSLSGIIGLAIGDYFTFAMFSIMGPRIGSVLTTLAPAAALISGALLVDEQISMIGILGIFITIAGVNFISLAKSERSKIPNLGHGTITWGITAGILASICQGVGLVFARKGLLAQRLVQELDPLHASFIRLSSAAISLTLFALLTGKFASLLRPIITNRNGGIRYALAGTLFGPVLGVSIALYAIALIDPSVAQTIFSLVPAVAFIISAIVYKEKLTLVSILGLIVAILGVVVLIWRKQIGSLFS